MALDLSFSGIGSLAGLREERPGYDEVRWLNVGCCSALKKFSRKELPRSLECLVISLDLLEMSAGELEAELPGGICLYQAKESREVPGAICYARKLKPSYAADYNLSDELYSLFCKINEKIEK